MNEVTFEARARTPWPQWKARSAQPSNPPITQYCRAQDLVDLQLMAAREKVDYAEVGDICIRLFANRRKQAWPAKVVLSEEWRIAYDRTKGSLPVLPAVDEAVAWANDLIAKIDAAKGETAKNGKAAKWGAKESLA